MRRGRYSLKRWNIQGYSDPASLDNTVVCIAEKELIAVEDIAAARAAKPSHKELRELRERLLK